MYANQTMETEHIHAIQESFELYIKILSWAHLNFHLQSLLYHSKQESSDLVDEQLQKLGYLGRSYEELDEEEKISMFEIEGFLSHSQTGKRIIAYALKEGNSDPDIFNQIEEAINNAYNNVRTEYGISEILLESYKHAMETLSIFKL